MKNLIYLILLNSLLGCQSNTPIDKPTPVQNKDTIIENPNSPVPILNTDTTAKIDTIGTQKQTTAQKKTVTTPKKKITKKVVTPKKHELGNDLVIKGATYRNCPTAACIYYFIVLTFKSDRIKILSAYCGSKKIILYDKTKNETMLNTNEDNEAHFSIGVPYEKEFLFGKTSSCNVYITSPPPIPYSGKMLIEYEINGKTKYQSIPAADFKQDTNQSESRGC